MSYFPKLCFQIVRQLELRVCADSLQSVVNKEISKLLHSQYMKKDINTVPFGSRPIPKIPDMNKDQHICALFLLQSSIHRWHL